MDGFLFRRVSKREYYKPNIKEISSSVENIIGFKTVVVNINDFLNLIGSGSDDTKIKILNNYGCVGDYEDILSVSFVPHASFLNVSIFYNNESKSPKNFAIVLNPFE